MKNNKNSPNQPQIKTIKKNKTPKPLSCLHYICNNYFNNLHQNSSIKILGFFSAIKDIQNKMGGGGERCRIPYISYLAFM